MGLNQPNQTEGRQVQQEQLHPLGDPRLRHPGGSQRDRLLQTSSAVADFQSVRRFLQESAAFQPENQYRYSLQPVCLLATHTVVR